MNKTISHHYYEQHINIQEGIVSQNDTNYKQINNIYQIYIPLDDGHKIFVKDRLYTLNKNDILLLNNTDVYSINSYNKKRISLSFDAIYIVDTFFKLLNCFDKRNESYTHVIKATPSQLSQVIECVHNIQTTFEKEYFMVDVNTKLALYNTLALLNEIKQNNKSTTISQKKISKKMALIQEYISNNYTNPIDLDSISQQCFINKYYLCRKFKSETGFSINEYITFRRISKAVRLLCWKNDIKAVAFSCGFNNQAYFCKVFKSETGLTPLQFYKAYSTKYDSKLIDKDEK